MKLSRRNLLIAGGAVGILPAFIAGRALARSPKEIIVDHLRAVTGNTTIPTANLEQFADTYVAVRRPAFGRKFEAAMVIMDNPWSRGLLPSGRRVVYEGFERSLLTDFLFSTDFFTSAGRDFQRMTYQAYADPYSVGCRNPLARFEQEA
ncbi:hypothetical protein [Sphingomonas sp. LHG3406-1]|uniref:hypothetical protein n=1 Tax=Sphingomonas sp. LHG3406-1 TaxID=2804617 RepID=UPI00261F0CAB|nr:hypothetical protein [Sphingomonas sp. LHG3406-1]